MNPFAPRRRTLARILSLAHLAALAATVPARAFSDRPVRIIVPFPPGGGVDNITRPVAHELAPVLGQPVVVENRAGAGGSIGLQALARATPDGHTLIVAPVGVIAINPFVYRNHPVDVTRDIAPVTQLSDVPLAIVVPVDGPFRDLPALVAALRQRDDLSYGSGGYGGISHLTPELFLRAIGGRALHVPYSGSAPAIADLIAGRTTFMIDGIGALKPHIDGGRLRLLATTGAERMRALPDTPTAAEAGVPGFSATTWNGVFVPAGTPRTAIDRLNAAIRQVTADPAFQARMEALGFVFQTGTPEELAVLVRSELARWRAVVEAAGVRVD